MHLDVDKRKREKVTSRTEDERAMAAGKKTFRQLSAENGLFSFPPKRVRLGKPRKHLR